MLRWYDFAFAIFVADIILTAFFAIPFIGAILAYVIYEYGWNLYCEFRAQQ